MQTNMNLSHVHGKCQGRESRAEIVLINGIVQEISYTAVTGLAPLEPNELRFFRSISSFPTLQRGNAYRSCLGSQGMGSHGGPWEPEKSKSKTSAKILPLAETVYAIGYRRQ